MSEEKEPVETTVEQQPVAQPEAKEPEQEIEITDAEQEEEPEAEPQEEKPFDPKTDKVEFTTPEQQEKFNYIYKQTKMSDARNVMLTDLLQLQQKRLDEMEARFRKTDSADAEAILMSKIKSARDAGDDAGEIAATREMIDFVAEKKLSEKVNVRKPPVLNDPPPVSPEAVKYADDFVRAIDDKGQLARPWMQENHPEHWNAISALENIAIKYQGDPQIVQKSLNDLDKMMRAKMTPKTEPQKPQIRLPSPMQGSNLTNQSPKTTLKMTRAELEVARKLGVDPKRYAAERDSRSKGKK